MPTVVLEGRRWSSGPARPRCSDPVPSAVGHAAGAGAVTATLSEPGDQRPPGSVFFIHRTASDDIAPPRPDEHGFRARKADRLDRHHLGRHRRLGVRNTKITGALVGAQPFGGFGLSGTDSKAGGPDYLPLHMLARTVVERF